MISVAPWSITFIQFEISAFVSSEFFLTSCILITHISHCLKAFFTYRCAVCVVYVSCMHVSVKVCLPAPRVGSLCLPVFLSVKLRRSFTELEACLKDVFPCWISFCILMFSSLLTLFFGNVHSTHIITHSIFCLVIFSCVSKNQNKTFGLSLTCLCFALVFQPYISLIYNFDFLLTMVVVSCMPHHLG